jgi:patatin-like phospholipase/acyl hydrolase
MSQFSILSLSGGGFKGLYSAHVLKELEDKFGSPLANKFDLIAGTSIGGILALGLAMEVPVEDMIKLFINDGKKIFKKRFSTGAFRPKYSNKGLRESLTTMFGSKTVGDLNHRVIIPSINYTKGGPQLFKTRHHKNFITDYKRTLVDVALATSAAPVFFPIHVRDFGEFVDGGLVANHPGFFANIEAIQFLNQKQEDIIQLHIGTLSQKYTSDGKSRTRNAGVINWGTRLIELIFSCQEQSAHQLLQFLGGNNYCSIDEMITDDAAKSLGLDKVTSRSKELLQQNAATSVQNFWGTDFYQRLRDHNAEPFTPEPIFKGQ